MVVGGFISRLVRKQPTSAASASLQPVDRIDNIHDFESAWISIQALLLEPDQKQLFKGITVTHVPATLELLLRALNTGTDPLDENQLDAYMKYALNHSIFSQLVELSLSDQPFGIKSLVVHFMSDLVPTVPVHVLSHPSVYQPIRQLLRYGGCQGDPLASAAVSGVREAAGIDNRNLSHALDLQMKQNTVPLDERLLSLWSHLLARIEDCSKLLLVFFPSYTQQSVHGPVSPPDPPPDVDTIGIDFLTGYLHDDKENGVVARAAICSLLRIAFNQPGFTTVECSSESSVRSSIAKHLCSDSSNFVEVLIAGLGAVYSVLPNRIRLETADEIALTCGSETMRLGSQPHPPMHDISSEIPFSSDDNVKCLFDGDVKTQLALLLDSIAFSNHIMQIIGDTTTSTNRVNVSRNKLQTSINAALQASFIGNVLYPALLESSTGDGSATAVAAYLACIFEDDSVVHHTSVGSVIIHHLLNLSPPQDCAENIQYTLRDCLIDMFLHGSRDNTIAASTLLEAIMHKYCDKVSIAILTEPSPTSTRFARDLKCFANDRMTVPTFLAIQSRAQTSSTPSRNAVPVLLPDGLNGTESASVYSPHAVQSYLALLPPLLSGQKSNDASDPQTQEAYEIDAFMAMSCHPCLTGSLARLDPLSQDKESQQHPHLRMNCDGSFLKAIRGRLRNFFSSEPYANLELTQAICKTANCPMTELEGWMLPENAKSPGKTVLGQDEVDLLNDPFLDYGTDSRNPVVLKLVGELVDDVKRFRASVPGFDTYLAERREGLLGIATNAKVETSIRSVISGEVDNPEDPTSLTPTKSTRTRMVSVLTSFLTPRKPAPSTPSLASQSKLATSPAEHFGTTADTHYRQTTSVVLDSPQHETLNVSASPYSILKRNKRVVQASLVSDTSSTASSEMYTSAAAAATNPGPNVHHVTLSRVLDNVVLLEAFIRQIVALLVARRSLGVDDLY